MQSLLEYTLFCCDSGRSSYWNMFSLDRHHTWPKYFGWFVRDTAVTKLHEHSQHTFVFAKTFFGSEDNLTWTFCFNVISLKNTPVLAFGNFDHVGEMVTSGGWGGRRKSFAKAKYFCSIFYLVDQTFTLHPRHEKVI